MFGSCFLSSPLFSLLLSLVHFSPREGNGNPHQYSRLENSLDGGAWWATVHEVAKSRTRLSDFTFFHLVHFVTESDSKHFLLPLRLLLFIPCPPSPSTPPKSRFWMPLKSLQTSCANPVFQPSKHVFTSFRKQSFPFHILENSILCSSLGLDITSSRNPSPTQQIDLFLHSSCAFLVLLSFLTLTTRYWNCLAIYLSFSSEK